MIHLLLDFSNRYLIEFMAFTMSMCFVMRWVAYYSSKRNDVYFSTLAREITLTIEKDKENNANIKDVDAYLGKFFSQIGDKLPNRSLRFKKNEIDSGKRTLSIDNYISGRENFVNILKGESGVFHLQTPPNFPELTQRILGQDQHWSMMLKNIPIDGVSRLIDIMPGLFVVFGVFGTFVGISMALPEIAQIDFNNIEASGTTLASFVTNTSYAMETSLAGIFFSVMMTVMNALFPIRDMRHRIHKKVESSLQTLWYHVQVSSKVENEMLIVLKTLNETLEKMNDVKETKENKKAAA